jgi:hypothetical protein
MLLCMVSNYYSFSQTSHQLPALRFPVTSVQPHPHNRFLLIKVFTFYRHRWMKHLQSLLLSTLLQLKIIATRLWVLLLFYKLKAGRFFSDFKRTTPYAQIASIRPLMTSSVKLCTGISWNMIREFRYTILSSNRQFRKSRLSKYFVLMQNTPGD